MTTTQPLPRWDMTPIYPGLESEEFAQGFAEVLQDIADLAQLFDARQIIQQPSLTVDDALIDTFETVIERYNSVLSRVRTLSAYISCFITTNSRDELAQARMSELQQHLVQLSLLSTRFVAWIGSLDVEALIERSSIARDHAFMLHKEKERAAHLMSPAEEALATELNLSSGTAWAKLHGNITSQISVPLEINGTPQEVPMSVIRNMAYEANRETRLRAYEAELAAWERVAVPLAAAFNSIKNEVNILTRRRQWQSPLAASLFSDNIDQRTLDAMLSAARAAFPDFRRYLHIKARGLGLQRLAWYDLFASIGTGDRVWTFDDAAAFIVEQFSSYSSRLAEFAARAFREQWIDAEPRPGKRDGAYCTLLRKDESRVFTNFKPSFGGVSTLAHELGHGYHNLNLAHRTPLQRQHPMTLAETASIFCETIIRQAALRKASREEQISILEAALQGSCQTVVDIFSRFLFEQRVFEKRQRRELSVDEFNNLMLEAQCETYGDGLDEQVLHPYMWAVKQHYYSTGRLYYNYPYMFGLLFGLGLYARYQQDPEAFKQGYDDLLASTGLADAATLAARFGIDLHAEAFWQSSLDIIRRDIDRFDQLV
ncbi:MAG TPA: M3 family oligoendopeptidase [Ktedonobacteraceae bacterium]|nr:M3 family oligoendopeptidase [Ktedonobacteraceae bacterium]